MNKFIIILGTILTIFSSVAVADNLPAGSYPQSCAYAKYENGMLKAVCKKADATIKPSSLDYKVLCKENSEVYNNNGDLTCNELKTVNNTVSGSYIQSCSNISYNNNTLQADCKTADNSSKHSYLAYKAICQANSEVYNDNGELKCDVPKNKLTSSGSVPGSYLLSCINIGYDGNTLQADCKKADNSSKHSYLAYKTICQAGSEVYNDNGELKCNTLKGLEPRKLKESSPPKASTGNYKIAGLYIHSCENIRYSNNILQADCKKADNSVNKDSYLNYIRFCQENSEVYNANGELKCNTPRKPPLPSGTYLQACHFIQFQNNKLSATCVYSQNGIFQKRQTSLDTHACLDDSIKSIDGDLSCKYDLSWLEIPNSFSGKPGVNSLIIKLPDGFPKNEITITAHSTSVDLTEVRVEGNNIRFNIMNASDYIKKALTSDFFKNYNKQTINKLSAPSVLIITIKDKKDPNNLIEQSVNIYPNYTIAINNIHFLTQQLNAKDHIYKNVVKYCHDVDDGTY